MSQPLGLLLRGIGELCTCDPERGEPPGVVRDAAVAARGDTIVFAGRERDLEEGVAAAITIDCGGAAVLPGFVDAHTHMVWLGERSEEYAQRARGDTYEAVAAAGGGIRATVRATAAGGVEELIAAARPRLRRALEHGTTTLELKSGYGLELDAELRQLEAARRLAEAAELPAVESTYLPLHAAPDGDREALVAAVASSGVAAARRLARFVDAFCDSAAFSVAECRTVLEAGRRQGLVPKLHAEQRGRSGGARLAAELGAASADHLEHADEGDCRALARAGVSAVLLPGAALVLGGPPPPGRRLLEAGASVAVATDCNPGTCFSESMPLMLSLAVALAGLTPAEALLAATRGGARALRLADRGVIRPGMRCDLAVLEPPRWLDAAYHLGVNPVRMVVRGGRVVHPLGQTPGRS